MLTFYLSLLDTEEEKSKMEALYITYKGLMLKIAYDISKDYDLANDALHNAFLKIVHHLNKIVYSGRIYKNSWRKFFTVLFLRVF